MKTDLYVHPDYFNMDDLLSEEHKLVRDAARAWVKKEVSPIIDEHYENAKNTRILHNSINSPSKFIFATPLR